MKDSILFILIGLIMFLMFLDIEFIQKENTNQQIEIDSLTVKIDSLTFQLIKQTIRVDTVYSILNKEVLKELGNAGNVCDSLGNLIQKLNMFQT